MRITLSELFDVEVVGETVRVRPTAPVELSPFWEIRLAAELERTHDADRLRTREIEVEDDEEGIRFVYGFAPAEAR